MSYLDIYDTGSENEVGYVVDISHGGMLLVSKDEIPVDQTYSYTIEIPTEILEEGILSINARSIRCIQDDFLNYYSIGFSFENLTEKHLEVVDNVVAALEL